MDTARAVEVLRMVAEDMAADAKAFDGRPFDGRTVAEYLGNQGAAIAAVANTLRALLEEMQSDNSSRHVQEPRTWTIRSQGGVGRAVACLTDEEAKAAMELLDTRKRALVVKLFEAFNRAGEQVLRNDETA